MFRLIVGSTVRLTAAGAATGLLLAAGAMRLLTSLLVGLGPADPPTFGAVGVLSIVVALGRDMEPRARGSMSIRWSR